MTKTYCDICSALISPDGPKNVIQVPCHIAEDKQGHGYVDRAGNQVSGRMVSFDSCNRCSNSIFRAAMQEVTRIKSAIDPQLVTLPVPAPIVVQGPTLEEMERTTISQVPSKVNSDIIPGKWFAYCSVNGSAQGFYLWPDGTWHQGCYETENRNGYYSTQRRAKLALAKALKEAEDGDPAKSSGVGKGVNTNGTPKT